MDLDASPAINFWKDPNAEPGCICGEGAAAAAAELTCPYNYLAPAAASLSYVTCRARSPPGAKAGAPSPGSCRQPVDLAGLFAALRPLRMWHVAMDGPRKWKGLACVVFQCREDERWLTVDCAYPSF